MARVLRFRHAAAHRFENSCSAQLRNQQSECVAARGLVGSDIAAGSCSSLDDAGQLELAQRAGDGRSRSSKCLRAAIRSEAADLVRIGDAIASARACRVFSCFESEGSVGVSVITPPDNTGPQPGGQCKISLDTLKSSSYIASPVA